MVGDHALARLQPLLGIEGAGGFERLGRLVERVPCFWLELGRDISALVDGYSAASAAS